MLYTCTKIGLSSATLFLTHPVDSHSTGPREEPQFWTHDGIWETHFCFWLFSCLFLLFLLFCFYSLFLICLFQLQVFAFFQLLILLKFILQSYFYLTFSLVLLLSFSDFPSFIFYFPTLPLLLLLLSFIILSY